MSIIIDYYNFLYKRYYDINVYIIEKNISLLKLYIKYNKTTIIIVFDSFYFRNQITNSNNNLIIYFSDIGITADDFILKKFSHYQGSSHILVSDDTLLKKKMTSTSRFFFWSTESFWRRLDRLRDEKKKITYIKKTTSLDNDEVDSLYFDYFSDKIDS